MATTSLSLSGSKIASSTLARHDLPANRVGFSTKPAGAVDFLVAGEPYLPHISPETAHESTHSIGWVCVVHIVVNYSLMNPLTRRFCLT